MIGSLLSLMQDQAFRQALARRSFTKSVRRMGEPFLLLVGYGNASRCWPGPDDSDASLQVMDVNHEVSSVELDDYRADAPGAARRRPGHRAADPGGARGGMNWGVVALAGDDETNLDVAMTTALLRPDLPVIARSSSRDAANGRAFHVKEVVNPLDRFGDHYWILARSPRPTS